MILVYCRASSGRVMAQDLGIAHYVFNRHNSTSRLFNGCRLQSIVNWGCTPSKLLTLSGLVGPVMNADISTATSKRTTLRLLAAANLPVPETLAEWRSELTGRWLARLDYLAGGDGIEILQEGQEPSQPYHFLTKYIAKDYEVRIHVFNGTIILEQFKYIPRGSGQLIRNHAAGATFSAKPLEAHLSAAQSAHVRDVAIATLPVLGLQFGAVDIVIDKKGNPFVLEVNTAPGLSIEAGTYPAYRAAFESLL